MKKRGCKISGKKGGLQACLLEALNNNTPQLTTDDIDKCNASMNGLAPTAFWKNLTCQSEPFPEPSNLYLSLCPPTERDESPPNPNHGFIETSQCPEFTGKMERMETQKSRKSNKQAPKLSPM